MYGAHVCACKRQAIHLRYPLHRPAGWSAKELFPQSDAPHYIATRRPSLGVTVF